MGWYDYFSRFYDRSLEPLYAAQREAARAALALAPGSNVLDVPCGTGQSFDGIAAEIGGNAGSGLLIGVDLSAGMLGQARDRMKRRGLGNVRLLRADVHALDAKAIEEAAGRPIALDRLHIFLGLTAFPRWEEAFDRLWSLLAPGGLCVIADVHADRLGVQGHLVNWIARADLRRRCWQPLERVAVDYRREALPSRSQHGGQMYLAVGRKSD